jgi:multidrug resistance efflux pump
LERIPKEKAAASADRQTSLTTTILSKQSEIARAEYDIKQMEAKIEKMQKALKNNKVKSTLDGIVKEVADRRMSPETGRIIVRGPVCRPGWLVEIEGIAVNANGKAEFKDFI